MEKYFVLSNGDQPDGICFSLESAKGTEAKYIDVFDDDGNKVSVYEFSFSTSEYTRTFVRDE